MYSFIKIGVVGIVLWWPVLHFWRTSFCVLAGMIAIVLFVDAWRRWEKELRQAFWVLAALSFAAAASYIFYAMLEIQGAAR